MGDPLSPVAPARVRAVLVPVGRIKRSTFQELAKRLQQEPDVRLGDISPDGRPDRSKRANLKSSPKTGTDKAAAMFSPLAFPDGTLFYDMTTSLPSQLYPDLTPLEMFREPLVLLGIADATEYQGNTNGYDQHVQVPQKGERSDGYEHSRDLRAAMDDLDGLVPHALVTQAIVMDYVDDKDRSWLPADAICVPSKAQSTSTTIKTVMCDVSSKFLAELGVYAREIKEQESVQSPKNPSKAGYASTNEHSSALQHQISGTSQSTRTASPVPGFMRGSSFMSSMTGSTTPPPSGIVESRSSSPHARTGPATSFDEIAGSAMSNGLSRSTSRASQNGDNRDRSRDRTSIYKTTASATTIAERNRNKGRARVGIVIGILYLMAGHWSEAWRELLDNTARARALGDHLWHAKGLENILICMLLLGWAGFDFQIPSICHPRSSTDGLKDTVPSVGRQDREAARASLDKLAQLLPDLINQILSLHERASLYTPDCLPSAPFSELVIRCAKLLAMIHRAGGALHPAVIDSMVRSRSKYPLREQSTDKRALGLSRHGISEIVHRAYPTAGVTISEAIHLFSGIASVFSILNLDRKKAMILKELLGSLVSSLIQARKVGAAEMGIHPAASLSLANGWHASEDAPGPDVAISAVIDQVQSLYEARADTEPLVEAETQNDGDSAEEGNLESVIGRTLLSAARAADNDALGNLHLKFDVLRSCIVFCEALPDLSSIARSAAALLRIAGPNNAIDPQRASHHVKLSAEEQARLLSNLARARNAAVMAGLRPINIAYWDLFLLRDVTLISDTRAKLRPHQTLDLSQQQQVKAKTPFLFDPYAKKTSAKDEESVLVAGEPIDVILLLQNPYAFEVSIDSVRFATKGADLSTSLKPILLRPSCLQQEMLSVTPLNAGNLVIHGCYMTALGCEEQFFPINQQSWTGDVSLKVKRFGVSDATDAVQDKESQVQSSISLPVIKELQITVIPPQPDVVMESVSLDNNALMILEGETKSFRITLRNAFSATAVDFLHVSFDDSITSNIKTALAAKEVSSLDMYEYEYQLLHNPVLRYRRVDNNGSEQSRIAPGSVAIFEISVTGKPGLSAGNIMFDYASLQEVNEKVPNRFFTRHLTAPFSITVNASVQLQKAELLPLPGNLSPEKKPRNDESSRSEQSALGFASALGSPDPDTGHTDCCLLLTDIRNAWPNAVTVTMQVPKHPQATVGYVEPGNDAHVVRETIQPGHIARMVIMLPKLYVQDPHAKIPSLSTQKERQFVVSSSASSPVQERVIRETFWYREALLDRLKGSWEEESTGWKGDVNLRSMRFSSRMLAVLRLDDIATTFQVLPNEQTDDQKINKLGGSVFQIMPDRFLKLRTTLHNRSNATIRAVLRLQPRSAHGQAIDGTDDSSRHIIWTGLLQQILRPLGPGESMVIDLGLVVLQSGIYEIAGLIEEISPAQKTVGVVESSDGSRLDAGLQMQERRIWRSDVCLVCAADSPS